MQWLYFGSDELPQYVRHRKAVGRRYIADLDVQAGDSSVPKSPIDCGRVRIALGWLLGDRAAPEHWTLCVLEGGGAFFLPSLGATWHLRRADRHFDVKLSSEAAGLCATRLAVNRLEWSHADQYQLVPPDLHQLGRKLARFAEVHPEGRMINRVLD